MPNKKNQNWSANSKDIQKIAKVKVKV